jgi:ferritin-like metal-binding protein YciE
MKAKTGSASRTGASKNNGAAKKAAPKKTAGKSTNGRTSNGSARPNSRSQGVKAKPDAAAGLTALFEDSLKDIYWAEKALLKALPKMSKNATSPELKNAIDEHLAVTEEQVARVEEVFGVIGKPAKAKKCEAMAGLIKEGEEMMQSTEKGMVRDAAIIAASQKIEHYEIASYGTLATFARTLGETEAADLLDQTLEEEKEADQTLTQVAVSSINVQAANEDDEDDDEEEEESDDEEEEDEE